MSKRGAALAAGLAIISVALVGCGDSVPQGGENAATHPASGIWVARTVGSENISGSPVPQMQYEALPNTAPKALPSGLTATETAVKAAITGGCWEDAHAGNLYGAYDQLFWWMGQCGDTVGEITVELYPTVAAATAHIHHASANALLARFQAGAVIVDVYANAPFSVLSQLAAVKGLKSIPGYAGSATNPL